MGFNTVAFVEEKNAQRLEQSPMATAMGLYYNYCGSQNWRDIVDHAAAEAGEPNVQGFTVLDSWHADGSRHFMSSDEGIFEGETIRYGILPDGTSTIELKFKKILEGRHFIAFSLNDMQHGLKESPKTIAWMLSHPAPNCEGARSIEWRYQNRAPDFGEKQPHPQLLDVLVGNPPGEVRYYRLGRNCIQDAFLHQQKKNSMVLTIWTADEFKKNHRMQQHIKKLSKEKSLKALSEKTGINQLDLKRFSNNDTHLRYDSLRKLRSALPEI